MLKVFKAIKINKVDQTTVAETKERKELQQVQRMDNEHQTADFLKVKKDACEHHSIQRNFAADACTIQMINYAHWKIFAIGMDKCIPSSEGLHDE